LPELVNYTPYPNFRYYSRDKDDREFGIIIVKATHELAQSGRLLVAEEQAPMVFKDKCHGAVNVTSLWHPSDLVPNKPATDVIVNAVACAPNGLAMPSWKCGLKIESNGEIHLQKVLQVTGPREWNPAWKRKLGEDESVNWKDHKTYFGKWVLSEPEAVSKVPLRYELAFGGEIATGKNADGNPLFDTNHYNPLGRGLMNIEWTNHCKPVLAPQIEDPDDPVCEAFKVYNPQGFGSIPPAWLPRRPLGGTYDQKWIDTVWPAWPHDYDFAYHQSAHPDLIVRPFLKGGEKVTLSGLASWAKIVEFNLPSEELFVDFVREDGTSDRIFMDLDTVFLDIASASQRDWRIFLSWRVNFEPDIYQSAAILRRVSDMSAELAQDEFLEGEPA
jgi:hypothetical protein